MNFRTQIAASAVIAVILIGLLFSGQANANDSMFPPQSVAQSTINFDGRGFLINGQRIFVASAGMEYARVPQALWADRLMRFKRAGFNCVELYVFWNYHETLSGQFNFTNNQNLDAYLKLAKSMGFYAIVRAGPYSCAEWDSGGFPTFLRFVPNLQVRTANTPYEQAVTAWFNQMLPIVINNQIDRGGNVILVQLENEHPSGWGTSGLSNAYFQYLQSTALAAGLEVPYFFSGLHHSATPAGSTPWSSSGRTSPWFTTEFWCNWFTDYGETTSTVSSKDLATWRIIAYGGNGYNYYMGHGGSNFNYFNCSAVGSSYDYGAGVGEAGDLRPQYYKYKRAAWFARSFQSILETSDNATSTYQSAGTNSSVVISARASTSGAGTILFLENDGTAAQTTQVTIGGVKYPETGSLTVNPSEIMPVVTSFPMIPGVTLNVAPTRILGITQQANTTTMVIYGQAGSPAELYFTVPTGTTITTGAPALSLNGGNLTLQTTYPSSGVADYSFQVGLQRMRILVVSDTLADDTWFVDVGMQNYVVVGPQYVGNATYANGYLQLTTETPWQNATSNSTIVYGPGDTPVSLSPITTPGTHPGTASLSAWQTMTGSAQAAASYSTTGWYSSTTGPQEMGVDGDVTADAWYRATFTVTAAGPYTVQLNSAADKIIPFVDGTAIASANVSGTSFTTNSLSVGTHTIAVFTAHYGHQSFYNYVGPLSTVDVKGITGPVQLLSNVIYGPSSVTGWKVMATTSSAVGTTPPLPSASGWTSYTVGTDAFNGKAGYAWFQTTLPSVSSAVAEIASFQSVDDNCWVYLNGTQLTTNTGWNVPFFTTLTSAWNATGTNVLTLLVQNTAGVGGLDKPVTLTVYGTNTTLNNWVQQGGPGNPNATTGWTTLNATTAYNAPQFFKTSFTAAPPGSTGTNPMWRVVTSGLSHGSVWVNGYNLGRYPQLNGAPGVYIPECWLNSGTNANTLVIYDESGDIPSSVQVMPETAASRDVTAVQSAQTLPTPQFALIGLQSGLALDAAGTTDGSIADLGNSNDANAQWTLQPAGNGTYTIAGLQSGRVLEVAGQQTANGSPVDILASTGGANQQWTLQPTGNGTYTIIGLQSARVLEVAGQQTAIGSPVDILDSNGGANQQWLLYAPAPAITSAATATATSGVGFNYTINASGGPTAYSATGLPPGLTLNPTTGIISGSSTALGTYTVTLTATNAAATTTFTLNLTVQALTPDTATDTPTMPLWALATLALLLFAVCMKAPRRTS